MTTILQIIPHMGTGGAEQAALDLAVALQARGDTAIVVSAGGWRVEALEKAGATHLLMPVHSKNPFKILAHARWLEKEIAARHVDIVHARSRAPAWSAYLACRRTGTLFVTTFHAAYKFKSKLKRAYNAVMAKAARIIAISDFIAGEIEKNYGVARSIIRTVPRGVDVDALDPGKIDSVRRADMARLWGLRPGAPVLLLPGRLSPIKGHKLFLEALEQMTRQDAQGVLVGDDQGRAAYSQELRDLAASLGIESRVVFAGACSDMPTAYSLADLVLAPSLVPEGFGRVPVEAMAMGIPALASNLGGLAETIEEGQTGWFLPPEDPARWAAAMDKALALSAEEKAAMAAAGRARARAFFTRDTMVARTLAVYDELTGAAK